MHRQSSSPENELAFRDVQGGDATALVRLAQSAAGASWNEDFVRWKYFANPTGGVSGCCAGTDESIVGFYGGVPVRIKVGDRVILGAQAADAMVSPRMRRRGLFVRMGRHTIRRLTDAGTDLIYAMANPISRGGSVKHLGFSHLGEIPTYVRIVDPAGVTVASGLKTARAWTYRVLLSAVRLAHRPARRPEEDLQVRTVPLFDERFEQLWQEASRSLDVAVVRDTAYLDWRYVQNPLRRYVILVAERGDRLLGYTVLSFRDAEQKGAVAVADLLVAPSETRAGLALLREATRRTRESGCGQIRCWMLPRQTFYTTLLRRSGFVYAPSRLVPGIFRQTTSFITWVTANRSFTPDPTKLENWFITMGDQDYY